MLTPRGVRPTRRQRRTLQRQIFPQALRLALVMLDDSYDAVRIARRAVRDVLSEQSHVTSSPRTAVLERVQRLAAAERRSNLSSQALSADERLARAVSELSDGQGFSHRVVARSLGTTTEEVARLHAVAHLAAGVQPAPPPRCSGWSLVRRLDDLSPAETAAAEAHIDLCRECHHAHGARVAAPAWLRKALPVGGGGLLAAGGVVGASLIIGGAAAGIVGLGLLGSQDVARTRYDASPSAIVVEVPSAQQDPPSLPSVAPVVIDEPMLPTEPTVAVAVEAPLPDEVAPAVPDTSPTVVTTDPAEVETSLAIALSQLRRAPPRR